MKAKYAVAILAIAVFCTCVLLIPFCASAQCGDCDDKNPCTKDYYRANVCVHEPIVDCGNDRTSHPTENGPATTSQPETTNPPAASLPETTSLPVATNLSEIAGPSATSSPEITRPETIRFQSSNDTRMNTDGTKVTGLQINNSESGKSEPSPNNNISKTTGILEDSVALNASGISCLAKDTKFGITNSTESENHITGNPLKMNVNTSFAESIQANENSSILQNSKVSTNNTNESIVGNKSLSLLHSCDDGNACTVDTWNGNGCVHTPVNCDDGNPCTTDSCENGVCNHKQKDCDDNDENTTDYCFNGACVHSLKKCDDGNACTIDTWNGNGCVHTPGNCDDGNPCTIDSCVNGECTHVQKNCDDGNACTFDTCDGRGNCVHIWRNCDDGNPCTIDECDPYWDCIYTAVVCGDGKTCVNGICQVIVSPSPRIAPTSYTISPGSTINLPWGSAVTAINSAKVENGIAYTAGQPIKFSRQLGYYQAASEVQGVNQATESAEMVGLSWQSNPFSVTLKKPDGSILSPESDRQNIKHVTGTNYDYYFLRNSAKGTWNIEIRPINPETRGEGYSLITGLVGWTVSVNGALS